MTISWQQAALDFGLLPEAGERLLSPAPAMIWATDGSRMLWANPAAGRLLAAGSLEALAGRILPEGHALRRAIASLSRTAGSEGTLARLRLVDDPFALPVACRCRSVRSASGRGLLVEAPSAGAAPTLADFAAFFSGEEVDAVVLDQAGHVVAGFDSSPAGARSRLPGVAIATGGGTFELRLIDRPLPRNEAAGVHRASVLDDAGLVMRPAARGSGSLPLRREPPSETPAAVQLLAPAARPSASDLPPPSRRESSPLESLPPEPPPIVRESPPVVREPERRPEPEPAPEAAPRSVTAGRVPRELTRKPVRFLWQTDASDRFLFVSPGLTQVVGRNAEVVGERWPDLAARLRLDPGGRIGRALRQRDTWSGLTAWWPIEGSAVRVPVELTALPVFGPDQSFQGYRGFGVLRPAEALMPAAFEARFGPEDAPLPEQIPPYEESPGAAANVVPIRSDIERVADHSLTQQERNAFEEIAAALRDRIINEVPLPPRDPPPAEFADEPPEEAEERAPDDDRSGERPALVRLVPPEESQPDAARAADAPSPTPPRAPEELPSSAVRPPPRGDEPPPAASRELSEARRRLRELTAILDTATDGVLILDSECVIESVNASAEALFGLEAHEMQGRSFGDLLTPASRKLALDYLSGLKDSGVASLLNEGREVEATAGGGVIPLFMTMGRLSSDSGGRFCAVLRDITHWKRIESELTAAKLAAEEASQQKSDFLARVSHEVRTPLNAIIGFAEVMIEERFGPISNERYREYLRDIRTSGEHVVSLVNDLLDISKIEAGKLDLNFAAVSLNAVVRESIALMQPQAGRGRVVLRSSLSNEVPEIVADERTLRQIVLNLLSNAVKFTEPGGQVIASTSLAESGEALLRVRDTGEGMTEEELARALEPFRQLSTATMSDQAGTGLGLPLTKALVEANRASLSIRSARGEGTVATVTIPATRVLSE